MGDGSGLVEAIRKVCEVGRAGGYFWRERYTANGPHGAEKYCEYPANLIRIVERFLLGVQFELDGWLSIAPCAQESYWKAGFGQTLRWRGRELSFRARGDRFEGRYSGPEALRLSVAFPAIVKAREAVVTVGGRSQRIRVEGGRVAFSVPAAPKGRPVAFAVRAAAVRPPKAGRN
jgi:hypothetical protein